MIAFATPLRTLTSTKGFSDGENPTAMIAFATPLRTLTSTKCLSNDGKPNSR